MSRTIEFFWDPASPYTYLASTQIEALAARCGVRVEWKPFLLGAVFKAADNRAPGTIPAKGKYLFHDVQLWARHYGVPLNFPKSFPLNSVVPQRVACAALNAGKGAEWAKAVMHAHWGLGRDVSQSTELEAVAASIGLDGIQLLAQTQEPAIKDQLRGYTDDAIARGAFGAPTFFVGKSMFWGNDRLTLLEEFLQGRLAA